MHSKTQSRKMNNTPQKPRVLYLTVPSFFDLEISLLRELDKLVDLTVMMMVIPKSSKSSAFDIEKLPEKCGVFHATEISGMAKYRHLLPLDKFYLGIIPQNTFSQIRHIQPKIKDFLYNREFDLLHATSLSKLAIFSYPTFSKIKHRLLTVHDPIPHNKLSLNKRILQEWCISWFRNILLLNSCQANDFKNRFHFRSPKLEFSRLGVYDFLNSYQNQTLQNLENQKYMLFFGRIEPYKGVDNLIKAYKASKASKTGIKLVIAGKGTINEPIGDSDNIICMNEYIPNNLLSNLIRNAMFTVVPYISATQSGVIMSSFACNTPVMVTPVGALPYSVKSSTGENLGFICKGSDPDSLIQSINHLVENPGDLSDFRKNITKATASGGELSWEVIASDLVKTYDKLLHSAT